jgi:heme-degrading monooxygenase HmoA
MTRLHAALLIAAAVVGSFAPIAAAPVTGTVRLLVAREWKGRVPAARADEYYRYLVDEGIKKLRAVPGSVGAEVLRRDDGKAVEFTVLSYWVSRESIKAFAGEDISKPHHLPRDKEFLIELPTRVIHYDVYLADLAGVATSP